jgi:hypothetical protein
VAVPQPLDANAQRRRVPVRLVGVEDAAAQAGSRQQLAWGRGWVPSLCSGRRKHGLEH